jgi:hypothetical protein
VKRFVELASGSSSSGSRSSPATQKHKGRRVVPQTFLAAPGGAAQRMFRLVTILAESVDAGALHRLVARIRTPG